jgi:hypothetical protein
MNSTSRNVPKVNENMGIHETCGHALAVLHDDVLAKDGLCIQ